MWAQEHSEDNSLQGRGFWAVPIFSACKAGDSDYLWGSLRRSSSATPNCTGQDRP